MSRAKMNFETTSRKLLSSCLIDGLRCAMDVRERIEIVHTSEYPNFLHFLIPAFRELLLVRLDAGKPIDSVESKFRHVILEILNRLPNNELLRPYTPELLRVASKTLARDNEDNALTCLRIVFDLHKNFRPSLESEVQAFLDLVNKIYRALPLSMEKAFIPRFSAATDLSDSDAIALRHLGSTPGVGETGKVPLEGIGSFKVLTECPLIVMLLFQLYPDYIQTNIPQLAPLMMGALALRVPQSAYKTQRERYMEFVACQVKTLSFLTYLLRGFSDLMRPYESAIARSVIALMAACPSDATPIRKELLVATRHILATEFRRGFFEHISRIFDEDILIGEDRRCNDSLRPLAFSTLADLVYHVLPKLTCAQLSTVVIMFSRNLHDATIPVSVQTTSVRLLLNLVEFIFHNVSLRVFRSRLLILCIARALVSRCSALRSVLGGRTDANWTRELFLSHQSKGPKALEALPSSAVHRLLRRYSLGIRQSDSRPQYFFITSRTPSSSVSSRALSDYGDLRSLLLTLLRGLKTVMWCISHYRSRNKNQVHHRHRASNRAGEEAPSHEDVRDQNLLRPSPATATNAANTLLGNIETHDSIDRIAFREESRTLATLFASGIECCRAYARNAQAIDSELKEAFDSFAGAFTVLDARSLCSSIGMNVPALFSAVQDTPQILGVAQLLLANTNSSELFAKLLLDHLVREIGALSFIRLSSSLCDRNCCNTPIKFHHASVALQLFKIVFGSVALFDGNKEALHGFVRLVVIRSLALAALAHEPLGFFTLLRALFRALDPLSSRTTRKLELSHSELEPVVPVVLRALRELDFPCAAPHNRPVVTELILTLPARLLVLIDHFSEMWPAILTALHYAGDLASVALRFVERCVDTIGLTVFFSHISLHVGLADALVTGVCHHINPLRCSNGVAALRLLGKLGGFSRSSFPKPSTLWQSLRRTLITSELSPTTPDAGHLQLMELALRLKFNWKCSEKRSVCNSAVSSGFELDIAPTLSIVCSLFQTLSGMALMSTFQGCAALPSYRTATSDATAETSTSKDIPSAIVTRFRTLCFRLAVTTVGCLVRGNPLNIVTACVPLRDSSHGPHYRSSTHFCFRREAVQSQLCPLFDLILYAAIDDDISVEALPILQALCLKVCWLYETSTPTSLRSDPLYLLDTDAVSYADPDQECRDVDKQLTLERSCGSFVRDALMNALMLKPQRLQGVLVTMLISSLDSHGSLSKHSQCAQLDCQVLPDIIVRLCTSVRASSRMCKAGIVDALVQITTRINGNLTVELRNKILGACLSALDSACTCKSMQSQNMIVSSICRLLRLSLQVYSVGSLPPPTARMLTKALCNVDPATRIAAQCALTEVSLFHHSEQASVFSHLSARTVVDILAEATRSWDNTSTVMSALDAATYLMALDPPALQLNRCLMTSLVRIITVASIEDILGENGVVASSHSSHVHSRLAGCADVSSPEICVLLHASGAEEYSVAPRLLINILMSAFRMLIVGIRACSPASLESIFTCTAREQFLSVALDAMRLGDLGLMRMADCLVKVVLTCQHGTHNLGLFERKRTILLDVLCSDGPCRYSQSASAFFVLKHLHSMPMLAKKNASDTRIRLLTHLEHLCAEAAPEKLMAVAPLILGLMAILPGTSEFSRDAAHLKSKMILVADAGASVMCDPHTVMRRLTRAILEIDLRHCAKHVSSTSGSALLCLGVSLGHTQGCFGSCAPRDSRTGRCACALPGGYLVAPLADFAARHPGAAIRHFFHRETLLESNQVDLLCSILTLSEASNLRSQLVDGETINILLTHVFKRDNSGKHLQASFDCHGSDTRALSSPGTQSSSQPSQNQSTVRGWNHVPVSRWSSSHGLLCEQEQGNLTFLRKFHFMRIVRTLVDLDSGVIVRNPSLIRACRALWREWSNLDALGRVDKFWDDIDSGTWRSFASGGFVLVDPTTRYEGIQLVAQCVLTYGKQVASDTVIVYEFLAALMLPSALDFADVELFLCETVPCFWGTLDRDSVFICFVRIFVDRRVTSEAKVHALRFIVTPMVIASSIVHGLKVRYKLLCTLMWCTLDCEPSWFSGSVELRVELLKLMTVLIEFHGEDIIEQRKEFIKFAWSHLKSEDSLARQWAYVNVCRFISTFDTPPKIVLQVFVALLRTFQPESRHLVRLALDILVPSLSTRLPGEELAKAMKWTKKVMYEEGHALPQLIHLWHIIVRHPGVFFPFRMQFLPQMVTSLNRLGLPPNCPVENRQLAIALADLIVVWEIRAQGDSPEESPEHLASTPLIDAWAHVVNVSPRERSQRTAPLMHSEVASLDRREDSRRGPSLKYERSVSLPSTMVEMLVNFLVRLALFSSDNKEPSVRDLANVCLGLLDLVLQTWPAAHIRFNYFEKLISTLMPDMGSCQTRAAPAASCAPGTVCSSDLVCTCLDIMILTLRSPVPPNPFLLDNLQKAQIMIFAYCDSGDADVQLRVWSLLEVMARLFPVSHVSSIPVLACFYNQLHCRIESLLNLAIRQQYQRFSRMQREGLSRDDSRSLGTCNSSNGFSRNRSQYGHATPQLLAALSALEVLCSQEHSNIANHGDSVIQVAILLANQHFTPTSVISKSQSAPWRSPHPSSRFACATPIMAVLGLSTIADVKPAPADDASVALGRCFGVLFAAMRHHLLQRMRRPLIALVFTCMERSGSADLLLTLTVTISSWLLEQPSMVTEGEQYALIESISSLDRLPELQGQPLLSTFLGILTRTEKLNQTRQTVDTVGLAQDTLTIRPFAAGMMSLHPGVRSGFCACYLSMVSSGSPECITFMLSADWSPVANRFWLVVVVEVLLDSIEVNAPLRVTASCIPLAQRVDVLQDWPSSNFIEALGPFCTSTRCFIQPIKELVHAHLRLAQSFLEALLPAAACNDTNEVARACAFQLAAKYHASCLYVPGALYSNSAFRGHVCPLPMAVPKITTRPKLEHARDTLLSCDQIQQCWQLPSGTNIPLAILSLPTSIRTLDHVVSTQLLRTAKQYNCHVAILDIIDVLQRLDQAPPTTLLRHGHAADSAKLLLEIFTELGDCESYNNTVHSLIKHKALRRAIALQFYGRAPVAQNLFLQLVRRGLVSLSSNDVEAHNTSGCNLEELEKCRIETELCADQWLKCSRELSQWRLLQQVSDRNRAVVGSSWHTCLHVAVESAWKCQQWDFLRTLLEHPRICEQLQEPQYNLHLFRLEIIEHRFGDNDSQCGKCVQSALYAWMQLPCYLSDCGPHIRLLRLFQELLEAHEGGQVLRVANEHSNRPSCPDFRSIVQVWRQRLPSTLEDVAEWEDIMCWRRSCFSFVARRLKSCCSRQHDALLEEQHWITSMLARTSRKIGLGYVADHYAGGNATDGKESLSDFYVLREKVLSLLPTGFRTQDSEAQDSEAHVRRGLHLIQKANISVFPKDQRSEIIRIEGLLQCALLNLPAAHKCLSLSTHLSQDYGRSWFSWACLCNTHVKATYPILLDEPGSTDRDRAQEAPTLVCYSLACFLASIECGDYHAVSGGVAQVLWLRTRFRENATMCGMLMSKLKYLPHWIWIPWLRHLMTALVINESTDACACLVQVVLAYPQAIFYPFRGLSSEDRLLVGVCGRYITSVGHPNCGRRMRGVGWGMERQKYFCHMVNLLHRKHSQLYGGLDAVCDELVSLLDTQPEERVRYSVQSLLHKLCDSPGSWFSTSHIQVHGVVHEIHKQLMEMARNLTPSNQLALQEQTTGARRSEEGTCADGHPLTDRMGKLLSRLDIREHYHEASVIRRLQESKCMLAASSHSFSINSLAQARIAQHSPFESSKGSENISHCVQDVQCRPEIPGQYTSWFVRPQVASHKCLMRFDSDAVQKLHSHTPKRHMKLHSDDGFARTFVGLAIVDKMTHYEERISDLFALVKCLLSKSVPAQKRRLWLSPRMVVPLGSSVGLSDDPISSTSLTEAANLHSLVAYGETGAAQVFAKKVGDVSLLQARYTGKKRLAVMHMALKFVLCRTCTKFDSRAGILTKQLRGSVTNVADLWSFRKLFAIQHAANCYIGRIITSQDGNPDSIQVSSQEKRIVLGNFKVGMSSRTEAVYRSAMPLRLTRNVMAALRPLLIESTFIRSFGLLAHVVHDSIAASGGLVKPALLLFATNEAAAVTVRMDASCDTHECQEQFAKSSSVDRLLASIFVSYETEIAGLTPNLQSDPRLNTRRNPEDNIRRLVHMSTRSVLVACMKPTWQPWM